MGQSDPISYTCKCPAAGAGGIVLLFYRYWANTPHIPSQYLGNTKDPGELSGWHRAQMEKHSLAGKARIACEGFNITLGGTREGIAAYISACLVHWSFSGLPLSTSKAQDRFFKPSAGCACVFGPDRPISVRVTAEITPMGVTGYVPADWSMIEVLSPQEFHKRCHSEADGERILLVDVRNHYESRIGYFVSPQCGTPAVRPSIRRFSQWPLYVKRRLLRDLEAEEAAGEGSEHEPIAEKKEGRQIIAYCTGGIRCEKGVRWMQEQLGGEKVCTLQGGIAAYLAWMDEEIYAGRKQPEESLFRGRNYVFDARGSTGLSSRTATEPIATCHVCQVPSDNLSKCQSKGCHLVLVACEDCNASADPRCCPDCRGMDKGDTRQMCSCEKEREMRLWGGEQAAAMNTREDFSYLHNQGKEIDIRVRLIGGKEIIGRKSE
jgi:predicted sulfurtransferase